jgi:hypothetical protein
MALATKETDEGYERAARWAKTILLIHVSIPAVILLASLLAYLLYLSGTEVNIIPIEKVPEDVFGDIAGCVGVVAGVNLWFEILAITAYYVIRKRPKSVPVRTAFLLTLVFLILMNIPFIFGTPAEIFSAVPDRGQGTGYWALGMLMLVPIFTLPVWGVGWVVGRLFLHKPIMNGGV